MTLAAILGGPRAVTADQEEANRWPRFDERDERAVLRVLRDGNLSTHPVIRELEADYAAFASVPYALAHASGTTALHAALFALDLQPGDEVLVPSATFWASVLPVVWAGAVPVFCESEPERLGIDPADMERKITARTRAVRRPPVGSSGKDGRDQRARPPSRPGGCRGRLARPWRHVARPGVRLSGRRPRCSACRGTSSRRPEKAACCSAATRNCTNAQSSSET